MKVTKKQGQQAFDIYTKWLEEGVPTAITSPEAYRLTNGLVGVPRDIYGRKSMLRLIEVAAKYVKKLEKSEENK